MHKITRLISGGQSWLYLMSPEGEVLASAHEDDTAKIAKMMTFVRNEVNEDAVMRTYEFKDAAGISKAIDAISKDGTSTQVFPNTTAKVLSITGSLDDINAIETSLREQHVEFNVGKKPVVYIVDVVNGTIQWVSGGWYAQDQRHLLDSQILYKKAVSAITAGQDLQDVISRLETAGFDVLVSDRLKQGLTP